MPRAALAGLALVVAVAAAAFAGDDGSGLPEPPPGFRDGTRGVPSSEFTPRELGWAWLAMRRGGRCPEPRDDEPPSWRRRRIELILRFAPDDRAAQHELDERTPTSLLRLAPRSARAAVLLLRRGEPVDVASLRDDVAVRVASGDREAVLRAFAHAQGSWRSLVELARGPQSEVRGWIEEGIARGDVTSIEAWLALGGRWDRVVASSPLRRPPLPALREGWNPADAVSVALLHAERATHAPSRCDALGFAVDAAGGVAPPDRPSLRAAVAKAHFRESDEASELLRTATLACLGDAEAVQRLAMTDWSSLPPAHAANADRLESAVTSLRGPVGARAALRFLVDPPPAVRETCGSCWPRTTAFAPWTWSAAERAEGLAVLDATEMLPHRRASFLRLRWILGVPPTAEELRESLSSRWGPLPRGLWGPDEAALRAEFVRRLDWRSFLELDGALAPALVDRAITRLAGDPDELRTDVPIEEALVVIDRARPAEAAAPLRDLLARWGDEDDCGDAWIALAHVLGRRGLAEFAAIVAPAPGPRWQRQAGAASALLTALIERPD